MVFSIIKNKKNPKSTIKNEIPFSNFSIASGKRCKNAPPISPAVGFASTAAIFLHEIPQEIGDFGVLIHGGVSKKRALMLNFLTAITSVAGGIFGFYLLGFAKNISHYLLALAAGGFIYIAASDLIPEIRKENDVKKSFINFAIIFLGILAMYLLKFLEA